MVKFLGEVIEIGVLLFVVVDVKAEIRGRALNSEFTTDDCVEPLTVLEYKPQISGYHPYPDTIAQIIPPGTPWPDSPEAYSTTFRPPMMTTRITSLSPSPDLIQRFPELTTNNLVKPTSSSASTEKSSSHIVLDYKPTTPFYHPRPITPTQLIPSGTPWPDSPQSSQTSLKPSSSQTTIPIVAERFPELTSTNDTSSASSEKSTEAPFTLFANPVTFAQLISLEQSLPGSSESTGNDVSQTTTGSASSHTILDYTPYTSFFYPNPVTPAQIIPTGTPWPASQEGYQKPSEEDDAPFTSSTVNLADRFPEVNTSNSVLEYKPSTSFHHPNPVTVSQIIPPGKPWPASANETRPSSTTKSTLPPNLVDRFPELTSHLTTRRTTPRPSSVSVQSSTPSTTSRGSSTHIVLEYKPQRPWYHPRPGNTVGQIIPPGKPWPASPDGYTEFSVTKRPPWIRFGDAQKEATKEILNVPEPNALLYYEPIKRTTSPAPFTSGTQKPTLSDILDILKELNTSSAPVPSHLLPFDADGKTSKEALIRSSVISPPVPATGPSYVNVMNPQPEQRVYDGTLSAYDPAIAQRVFPNPKYVLEQRPL